MATIRVKMRTNIAGHPSYHTGEIVELEDRIATAWIKEGYATPAPDRDDDPAENAKKK